MRQWLPGRIFLVFFFMSLLIVSKLSGVRLFWSVVTFFASRSAVSLPCIPTCEGTHRKATVLPCLLRSFIVLLASFTVWVVACLFEATVWMADWESTRRMAFSKDVGLSIVAVPWLLMLAQKLMLHIFFFSETTYSECMKFTHSITGCFLYTCYFST